MIVKLPQYRDDQNNPVNVLYNFGETSGFMSGSNQSITLIPGNNDIGQYLVAITLADNYVPPATNQYTLIVYVFSQTEATAQSGN